MYQYREHILLLNVFYDTVVTCNSPILRAYSTFICILFSRDYWRKGNTECPITATPGFSQLLKQNRFETILRSIHLYNPADAKKNGWDDKEGPNWDPIHKCRQFIELVFARILEAYVPDRHVGLENVCHLLLLPYTIGYFLNRSLLMNK